MRPPAPGSVPKLGLVETHTAHCTAPSGHEAWGWVEYSRELNPEEVEEYELEFVVRWME